MRRYFLRNENVKNNAINEIRGLHTQEDKPLVIEIKEFKRSLQQNARLHAMLSEISKKADYHGKKRSIEFWKGLFVSAWQIATHQNPEIVQGLEGELINIRESTTTLSVRQLNEVMDYIEAYCAMNSIELSDFEGEGLPNEYQRFAR